MGIKCFIWFLVSILNISQAYEEGITCYKCTGILRPGRKESELCSRFDGSDGFKVDCPSSTFCMKRTVHYTLPNGTSISTVAERDCAPQKYFYRVYDYNDEEWHDRTDVVKSAYEEGCTTGEDRQGPGGPSEYCFCSYHLCNKSAPSKIGSILNVFLAIVSVLMCFIYTEHLNTFIFVST